MTANIIPVLTGPGEEIKICGYCHVVRAKEKMAKEKAEKEAKAKAAKEKAEMEAKAMAARQRAGAAAKAEEDRERAFGSYRMY